VLVHDEESVRGLYSRAFMAKELNAYSDCGKYQLTLK